MKITEVNIPLTLPPSKIPRSEGVHVSSIIRSMAIGNGALDPKYADDLSLFDVREITDPVAILRMSIGLAWEQFYIPEVLGPMFDALDHPGEMEVDGIYMTHDAESVSVIITDSKYHSIVHEVKATYKSRRTVGDLSNQWMWLTQCKAYCKGVGTRFAMIHVLFLCGDYGYPITPQLRCWQVEFTQSEVDMNWELIKEYLIVKQVEEKMLCVRS